MKRCYVMALLCGIIIAPAYADDAASAWYRAGHVLLNVTDSHGLLRASWRFDRASNGDIRVVKQEQHGIVSSVGSVMSVCGDQALLFDGLVPPKGREMDELNTPILLLQLTLKLLAHALPAGPQTVTQETMINIEDAKHPIQVHKGTSVRRDFLSPWRANGFVTVRGQGTLDFKIHFVYKESGGADATADLDGEWRQPSDMPSLDNAFSLENWHVYRVNTVLNFVAGRGQFDSVVVPQPLRFKTVGALRSHIEQGWSPSLAEPKRYTCPQ
jgi:hypothetical protein